MAVGGPRGHGLPGPFAVCLSPPCPTLFLTQLCFLFLCQSISGSEGLSRPWALTCCSIAHCCYAGVAAARWTSFL